MTILDSSKLAQARDECTAQLNRLRGALSMLESLGVEMTDLVEQQQSVEVRQVFLATKFLTPFL